MADLDRVRDHDISISHWFSRAAFRMHVSLNGFAGSQFRDGLLGGGVITSEAVELAPLVTQSVVARVDLESAACMSVISWTR